MLNNLKPYQRHLIIAAAGTGVLWLALTYLPKWAILVLMFGVLYAVAKNNVK